MSNPDFAETVSTCSEAKLYFIIEEIGGMIWRINHDVGHGRMPASCLKDLPKLNEHIQTAVGHTLRFGVEDPLRENGAGNDNYWKWYRWWNAWHKVMSDEDWDGWRRPCNLMRISRHFAPKATGRSNEHLHSDFPAP